MEECDGLIEPLRLPQPFNEQRQPGTVGTRDTGQIDADAITPGGPDVDPFDEARNGRKAQVSGQYPASVPGPLDAWLGHDPLS
jgi:hypothetical protein